jgi:transposase
MNTTTVGVDLAKNCFQVAEADERFRVQRRDRFTRGRFARFMSNHPKCLVVMEACGSAHYWARQLQSMGHEVKLLPAQYVRAYVARNKTDAVDAAALIEASRNGELKPVPVKTVEQQGLQQLHRIREQCKSTRNARMNLLRGMLREYGIDVPVGINRGLATVREALEIADNGIADAVRPYIEEVLQEIQQLREGMKRIERSLLEASKEDEVVQRQLRNPGIGLLMATALRASVVDIQRFPTGRHFACWLGITAREDSSGLTRRLGPISKRGDAYLRTLLIAGARAVLHWAKVAKKAGKPLDHLRVWALETEARIGHNKAAVALANKLARIIWATWKYERDFDGNWSTRHPKAGANRKVGLAA